MNRTNQSDCLPRFRDSERTLSQQLIRTQCIEWMLLCVDLPAVILFLESDIADLQRISLPFWWVFGILVLHIVVTMCICGYLSSTLRYLCVHKPSMAVKKLRGTERQKYYQFCSSFDGFFGGISGVGLVILTVIPHILMVRRPDYHFFGFIIAKVALFAVAMQGIMLAKASAEVRGGIKEWDALRRYFPYLSFAEYAEKYDGYEESLFEEE